MADRQPTIEQKSHFIAKSKQGQDVEFVATLRFYVTPTGDVTISAPGSTRYSDTHISTQTPSKEIIDSNKDHPSNKYDTKVKTEEENVPFKQNDKERVGITKSEEGTQQSSKNFMEPKSHSQTEEQPKKINTGEEQHGRSKRSVKDDAIERAFPTGPDDCGVTQFIPDPCRALNDLQKSLNSFYRGIFSGRDCPPPQNTENNINTPITSQAEFGYLGNLKNGSDNDMLEKEEKYEV